MPWTPNDAERHTRKATTRALEELWAKVATKAWNEPATKAALSGKRTLWSRGKRNPAIRGARIQQLGPNLMRFASFAETNRRERIKDRPHGIVDAKRFRGHSGRGRSATPRGTAARGQLYRNSCVSQKAGMCI